MSRSICIGDVHGCRDEFEELVRKIAPGPEDQVFCVGDFMDRGPDPVGCVRFARESGFRAVLGNHEEKHLRWRRHETRRAQDPNYVNPMGMHPQRQVENAALTAEDIAWLEGLPLTLEPIPGWLLVHGGLFPGVDLDTQLRDKKLREKLIRLRWVDAKGEFVSLDDDTAASGPLDSRPWMESYDGPFNVVYGHAVHSLSTVRVDKRPQGVSTYGIDTGACFGGSLTAIVLEVGAVPWFVQVQARRVYSNPRWPIAP